MFTIIMTANIEPIAIEIKNINFLFRFDQIRHQFGQVQLLLHRDILRNGWTYNSLGQHQ